MFWYSSPRKPTQAHARETKDEHIVKRVIVEGMRVAFLQRSKPKGKTRSGHSFQLTKYPRTWRGKKKKVQHASWWSRASWESEALSILRWIFRCKTMMNVNDTWCVWSNSNYLSREKENIHWLNCIYFRLDRIRWMSFWSFSHVLDPIWSRFLESRWVFSDCRLWDTGDLTSSLFHLCKEITPIIAFLLLATAPCEEKGICRASTINNEQYSVLPFRRLTILSATGVL